MIRVAFILFSILIINITASAQEKINISGKILNKDSKEIIVHAFIKVGHQITVLSNHQGEFHLHNLPKGTINLDITHVSYHPHKISLEINADTTFNISLAPKAIGIDEVDVVSQNKSKTNNALTKAQILENKGKTLGDALSEIAGVSILRTGSTIAKPMINGLFGNRIIVLNNGTRHESQQWGLDHAPEIDPFAFEKFSVIKSAEALRYGADALGGLVNLEKQDITTNKIISGNIHIGAHTNGRGGVINTNLQGVKSAFRYQLGLTALQAGNLKTPDYYIGNTGRKEMNGHALLQYIKENQKLDVYLSHFGSDLGIFHGAHIGTKDDILARIAHGKPLDTYDFSYDIEAPKQTIGHQLGKIGYSFTFQNNNKIESYYSFQQNHRQEYDLRRAQSDDIPMADITLTTQQAEIVYLTQNSQLGVFGSLQINNNKAGTGTTPIIPNFDNHNLAIFGSHKIHYGNNFLEFGGRYDYKYFDAAGYRFDYKNINSDGSINQYLLSDRKNFNNFSGVIGNNWQLSPKFNWKNNVSLAWRAPSASELYSDGIHHGTGTYEVGNIQLKSEKGYKWLNSLHYKNKFITVNADIFGQIIDNYIYNKPNPDSVRQTIRGSFPIFQYEQDKALFYGFDLQTKINLSKKLDYEMNFSSVRAKNIDQGTYLPYIPADRVQQAIVYAFSNKEKHDAYIKLKHLYQAKQTRYEVDSDFASPPASYHTFNLILSNRWKLHTDQSIGFLISIDNVFNKEYKDYLDRLRYYTHSTGRNTSLKINYTF